jgi:hypothetical protein
MCWTDEASDACWEGVRVGFRTAGLLEAPPAPLEVVRAAGLPAFAAPTQAALHR